MKRHHFSLLSFLFVVCLMIAGVLATYVATTGTSGFMTRAEGSFNCYDISKRGESFCKTKKLCKWVSTGKKTGFCSSRLAKPSKLGGNIDGDPKPDNPITTSADQGNVPKMDNPITTSADQSNVPKMTEPIKTTTNQSYVPIGWSFQKGFPVNQSASTKFPECPISPDVTEIGNTKVFAEGVGFYIIKLCKVHGYAINSIKAKDFDNMFVAMKAAGYSFKGDQTNFRTSATQQAMNRGNPDGVAAAGGSNHERGLAVDISCFNTSGDRQAFKPWMFGKKRGLAHFEKAIAEHPCLRWIHNNAPRYRLLLMCDGKGDYGEIAVKTGGCETWHLSPTGH